MMRLAFCLLLTVAPLALAQDPADGWLGYAVGTYPSGTRITYMEAKWKVGAKPRAGGAFYSPWFGIEASDNLNLIQPVNPWMGSSWSIYNEYYQWEPEYNYDSPSHTVKPGDILFGSVTYVPSNNTYTVYHSDLNDGWSVTSSIGIQKTGSQYKLYTIAYIVFEKDADCDQYPSDGQVTFYDIKIQYDGQTVSPQWDTGIVDDVCNNRAHIINETCVQITWDTSVVGPRRNPQKTPLTQLHPLVDESRPADVIAETVEVRSP